MTQNEVTSELESLLWKDGKYQPLLPALLLRAHVWVEQCIEYNLQKRGISHLSRVEAQIMAMISAGITRPVDVADALGISRQSLNQIIRQLQARHLVELRPDPSDRRCKIISFSGHGERLVLQAVRVVRKVEAELKNRLGDTALIDMMKTLDKDFGEMPYLP